MTTGTAIRTSLGCRNYKPAGAVVDSPNRSTYGLIEGPRTGQLS